MRSVLRSWVLLLALALALNGAVVRQCAAAHQAAGEASTSHDHGHQHASQAAGSGDHKHHHADHGDNAVPAGAAVADEPACANCCGICTLASGLPPQIAMPADLHGAVSFARLTVPFTDADIRVDPGIPKRIA
jgi:hypothetical protein